MRKLYYLLFISILALLFLSCQQQDPISATTSDEENDKYTLLRLKIADEARDNIIYGSNDDRDGDGVWDVYDDDDDNDGVIDASDDNSLPDLEMHDVLRITLTNNGEDNHTYDYTGLLLDDSYIFSKNGHDIKLEAYYYNDESDGDPDNDEDGDSRNKVFINPDDGVYDWSVKNFTENMNFSIEDLSTNYFVQSATMEVEPIDRASVYIKFFYGEYSSTRNYDEYFFKGFHDDVGGDVELVGKIVSRNGKEISNEGDTDIHVPYEG